MDCARKDFLLPRSEGFQFWLKRVDQIFGWKSKNKETLNGIPDKKKVCTVQTWPQKRKEEIKKSLLREKKNFLKLTTHQQISFVVFSRLYVLS